MVFFIISILGTLLGLLFKYALMYIMSPCLILFYIYKLLALLFGSWQYDNSAVFIYHGVFFFANVPFIVPLVVKNFEN